VLKCVLWRGGTVGQGSIAEKENTVKGCEAPEKTREVPRASSEV
jgi:hypothetical protein